MKWDAVFTNRTAYLAEVHDDVKEWVAKNVVKWRVEQEKWFNIELIPDKFLPKSVLEEEGGANRVRKRSTISAPSEGKTRVHPESDK